MQARVEVEGAGRLATRDPADRGMARAKGVGERARSPSGASRLEIEAASNR